MRPRHTAILICLDETGSMSVVRDATISAFNEFVRVQKDVAGTAEIWLQRFNTEYRRKGFVPEMYHDLAHVPALSKDNYRPTASTPLYDAVGYLIESAGKAFAARAEAQRPEKVLMLVQTDGLENSSSDYSAPGIRAMIEHQREKYGWQFTFLGADQDAWVAGEGIGIPAMSTLSYANTLQETMAAYSMMGEAVRMFRIGKAAQIRYDKNDIREH